MQDSALARKPTEPRKSQGAGLVTHLPPQGQPEISETGGQELSQLSEDSRSIYSSSWLQAGLLGTTDGLSLGS